MYNGFMSDIGFVLGSFVYFFANENRHILFYEYLFKYDISYCLKVLSILFQIGT